MSAQAHYLRKLGNYRMLLLLISLVFIFTVVPAFEQTSAERVLMHFGLTCVMIFAAMATRRRRILLILGGIVAALGVSTNWATLVVSHEGLFVFSCLLESAFFVTMAVVILLAVFRKHIASVNSIFGVICAYLLLGLAWALLYLAMERVNPEALAIKHRPAVTVAPIDEGTAFSQWVYFSFVTMSTLGYGDITPETPVAQTVTWMQSVTGQFYMAVLVAWIIGALPRQGGDHGKDPEEDS